MRRAFSLVEVLLAILILALGLLGLGAVIPVIVKQQRTATDRTLGVAAAKSAHAYLMSKPQFDPAGTTGANAWQNWLGDPSWSPAPPGTGTPGPTNFLWQRWRSGPNTNDEMDETTGEVFIKVNPTATPSASSVAIPLIDRLWPGDSTQPMQLSQPGTDPYRPQFVWDLIGRRVQTAPNQPQQIQAAIFVRRIDMNIKVPKQQGPNGQSVTLRDVLLGRNGVSDWAVPVAVINNDTNPLPTHKGNNGPGEHRYGNFRTLGVTFHAGYREWIEFDRAAQAIDVDLASQPNQQLLDNFGNVYTVLGIDEAPPFTAGGSVVRVSPPIPMSVPDRIGPAATVTDFRQVVFTPQVTGAVLVFNISRPVN